MNKIEYYKSNEVFENNYYQIPQELFTSSLYKDKLTSDSKILYAFLLDRLTLSQKNHWIDENNYVFLIFTRHEVQDKLGLSEKTVIKAFKQLADVNLISEKRQGLGKPNLIYVGKIIHEEIVKQEKVQIKSCKKYSSRIENNTTLDKENLHTINTNNSKNELINIDTINPKSSNDKQLEKIKDKCKLEEFTKDKKAMLEDVIDTLYHKDTMKVRRKYM